ncbi:hypothetical protein Tco_0118474, partial [Tanacetum coccineum]
LSFLIGLGDERSMTEVSVKDEETYWIGTVTMDSTLVSIVVFPELVFPHQALEMTMDSSGTPSMLPVPSFEPLVPGSEYQQKDRKPSQNDKTEHGMEKTVQNQGQRPKMSKSEINTEESAVKPEPELKNTIECNLNPPNGPGKPNSIIMKTV